jgi:hypothetical protein
VTFVTYPEVPVASTEIVTVAATKPILLEEEIDLSSPSDSIVAEEAPLSEVAASDDAADDVAAALAEALAAARAASEAATEPTALDQPANETRDGEVKSESLPAELAEQLDMDLELINVEIADAGNRDADQGPRFKVTIRNAGKRDLEKFLVSLVACKDAQIDSASLHASATVDALAAGGETTVEVTLPAASLTLNRDVDGREAPFSTLIAAVDSDERINEGNEENNLSLIDRTSIRLAGN